MTNLISASYSFLKKNIFFIFVAFALCANLYIVFNGFAQKDRYHIDEQWSYAHSNSNGIPYIGKVYKGNVWLSPQVYHNYLTVQRSDGFNYSHIYENLKKDKHTPLYFMTLYTVSWFFPDKFSPWIGGGLNIFLWLITLAVMYKLSRKFFKERWLAIAPLILYSFSVIGISTVIYIRNYLMQTLFATCLIIEMLSYIDKDNNKYRLTALKIFIFSLLGMLTSYNSIVFSFFLSVVFGSYLLFKKEYKKLLYLALAMSGSFIFFVYIFPHALLALVRFNPKDVNGYRDIGLFSDMLSIYWPDLFNTNIDFYSNSIYTYIYFVLTLYFIALYLYCVDFSVTKNVGLLLLTFLLVSLYLCYTLPEAYEYKSRYRMLLYPSLSILSLYMIYHIFTRFLSAKKSLWCLYALILLSLSNVNYQRYCPFLMHHPVENSAILTELKDKKIVVASPTYWAVEDASYVYLNAKKIYFVPEFFYTYVTDCEIDGPYHKYQKSQNLFSQFRSNLNQGDYLLVLNDTPQQFKHDKNSIKITEGSLCEDLKNKLQFVKTMLIGVLYWDIYKIIPTEDINPDDSNTSEI